MRDPFAPLLRFYAQAAPAEARAEAPSPSPPFHEPPAPPELDAAAYDSDVEFVAARHNAAAPAAAGRAPSAHKAVLRHVDASRWRELFSDSDSEEEEPLSQSVRRGLDRTARYAELKRATARAEAEFAAACSAVVLAHTRRSEALRRKLLRSAAAHQQRRAAKGWRPRATRAFYEGLKATVASLRALPSAQDGVVRRLCADVAQSWGVRPRQAAEFAQRWLRTQWRRGAASLPQQQQPPQQPRAPTRALPPPQQQRQQQPRAEPDAFRHERADVRRACRHYKTLPSLLVFLQQLAPCHVSSREHVLDAYEQAKQRWNTQDILAHCNLLPTGLDLVHYEETLKVIHERHADYTRALRAE